MSLNSAQTESLAVVLRRLEHALLQLRQNLRRPPEPGWLTHYTPIAPEIGARLEARIEPMLAEIERLADAFDLQPEAVDLQRQAASEMVVAWADLTDTLSPKLRRYGPVDPALAQSLDPHLRALIQQTSEIGQLLARPAGAPGGS